DPQVIVFTEWMGRSPTLVEDQVTYPIVSKLIGAPHVTDVRGFSMFGMSFVHVVFAEGTDVYWARSRVLEYMNGLRGALPEGASPVLGPDATGIGWVFQYTLTDRSGRHGLDDLRTFQDFTLRYGENALDVIERVKKKLADLRPSFPEGVEVTVAYDRSGLIERSVDTLKHALIEEAVTVSLVIILFLLHLRSSLLPILSLPISV